MADSFVSPPLFPVLLSGQDRGRGHLWPPRALARRTAVRGGVPARCRQWAMAETTMATSTWEADNGEDGNTRQEKRQDEL